MSNWIFDPRTVPSFRSMTRTPMEHTIVQPIDSGKEARIQKYVTPRWRYELGFEYFRTAANTAEYQQIQGLFTRLSGMRDNFLLRDPDDNAVTDHGFGVGDGATTTFQLQRSLLAGTLTQDALGSWETYTKPRMNLIIRSQEFDNASWSKNLVTATANQAVAPDGSLTAEKIAETAASGQHYVTESITLTAGVTYTLSAFVRAAERSFAELELYTAADNVIASFNLSTGVVSISHGGTGTNWAASLTSVGNGWYRIAISETVGTGGSFACVLAIRDNSGNQSYLGVAGSGLYYWGAQLETGAVATQYFPTTTAAVRDDPLYWPSFGDGFEPVLDPNFASITIFKDGVAQAVPSAWSPGAGGTVVFASAPAAGAALSWTGSFWRRVRMNEDEPAFERVIPGVYKGSLELVSVI